ncbi:AAA family ATPase, partial [Acidobacteriota bacterium]
KEQAAEAEEHKTLSKRDKEITLELQKLNEKITGLEEKTSELLDVLSDARMDLAARREAKKALEMEIVRLGETVDDSRKRIEALDAGVGTMKDNGTRLSDEIKASEEALATLFKELEGYERSIADSEERAKEKRELLDTAKKELSDLRVVEDEVRTACQDLEIKLTRREEELRHNCQRCAEELHVEAETLACELTEQEQASDIDECKESIEIKKDKIEGMGAINLMAVEEYEQLVERHDYLETQIKDLNESIASLKETIAQIEKTSLERFTETYGKVNEFFQKTFEDLFEGGKAFLELTDEDNPLESGIEIIAQPPGKRLQNILLLSGGEKALTAIALLFSLFQYKPSPFCILDEVDAPLDDPNIERFLKLMKLMAGKTQFILITHSRRTMERADVLYGVTMQEPGISTIVSVNINDNGHA